MSATPDFQSLQNRLVKNQRHLAKWARRQQISCYRLYDRDIPAFPLVIDLYTCWQAEFNHPAELWLHLQEFDTGWQQTEADYLFWQDGVLQAVAAAMQIPVARIVFKLRARQRSEEGGRAQYEKTGESGTDFVVQEGRIKLWVNLQSYLDSGLFLDHRPLRLWLAEQSQGRRVLNLFAYTAAFTVHAAVGGASYSETVDLSNTYQAWSARNFELNGLNRAKHVLIRADVFRYLEEAIQANKQFDVIVLDPPTFSNSKKMDDVLDIQRDHRRLIDACLDLLAEGGRLIFSTNYRGFKLDADLLRLPGMQAEEVSSWSVPEDCRDRKIHRAWWLIR